MDDTLNGEGGGIFGPYVFFTISAYVTNELEIVISVTKRLPVNGDYLKTKPFDYVFYWTSFGRVSTLSSGIKIWTAGNYT